MRAPAARCQLGRDGAKLDNQERELAHQKLEHGPVWIDQPLPLALVFQPVRQPRQIDRQRDRSALFSGFPYYGCGRISLFYPYSYRLSKRVLESFRTRHRDWE